MSQALEEGKEETVHRGVDLLFERESRKRVEVHITHESFVYVQTLPLLIAKSLSLVCSQELKGVGVERSWRAAQQ